MFTTILERWIYMTKDDLWNLFKMTGDITYYLRYKDAIKKGK